MIGGEAQTYYHIGIPYRFEDSLAAIGRALASDNHHLSDLETLTVGSAVHSSGQSYECKAASLVSGCTVDCLLLDIGVGRVWHLGADSQCCRKMCGMELVMRQVGDPGRVQEQLQVGAAYSLKVAE